MRDTARYGRDTIEIQLAWRAVKDVQPHLEALGLAGQRLKVIEHLTARLDRLWEEVVHRKAASDLAFFGQSCGTSSLKTSSISLSLIPSSAHSEKRAFRKRASLKGLE